jgi:hypothetical protein
MTDRLTLQQIDDGITALRSFHLPIGAVETTAASSSYSAIAAGLAISLGRSGKQG